MAQIFPERLPLSVIDDPFRTAERKVYAALKALPDKYRIFYSVFWQAAGRSGVYEREADFVIAHPDKGFIVLEVKGGGITFDAVTDQWRSIDRDGQAHLIKDPVEQARISHYELRHRLEALPGWTAEPFNSWHAVAFPDIVIPANQSLKVDLPRQNILDSVDISNIAVGIENLFRYCFAGRLSAGAPGEARLRLIEGLLANSFSFRTPLGVDLAREDEKLVELTEQQFHALSLLGQRKRAAIAGCAGSGKTMLALRKAQQFEGLGLSVLFVCFNNALAENLRQSADNIDVYSFHALCRQAAADAGLIIPAGASDQQLYQETLPEALLDAASRLGRLYDVIIVDEGQDFQENYWIALESLLKSDGYLYVFFDDNQNLFGGQVTYGGLIPEVPFVLSQNCRNTKAIHSLVATFHNNPESLISHGPDGRPPETIVYSGTDDMLRKIQKILHHLIIDEHILAADIVILTPHGETTTALKPGTKLGLFTFHGTSRDQYTIQVSSIQKFKGLEKRVVILAEIDDDSIYNYQTLMYVGCSRARTHLIILRSNSYEPYSPESATGKSKTKETGTGGYKTEPMKYRELIQFEPVTTVIQLKTANDKEKAAQLIDTYVVSKAMADTITSRLVPLLNFDKPGAGRGLFIVGNYGTGKSHLMSVLTAIAEHGDLVDHLKDDGVRQALQKIAGKFKISRQETSALDVPLRNLVFAQLEQDLAAMGVSYKFPGDTDTVTNKKALEEMLAVFQTVYPGQGLLIALDELLDFLKAKKERDLILDLNFLREVGEICELTPIRFMAGIQESLFDSSRFQFISNSITRVKARFDQATILRDDIAFVVTNRLLRKTAQQKAYIKKHLEQFTPLYTEMSERLDQYVDLFPVHPAYLEVFERVTIGERRELLSAISQEISQLLDHDLPTDHPGLITFDSYWRMISADTAYRSTNDVRIVLDKSQVLREKILHAKLNQDFRTETLRLIDGLAMYRLTVSDIYTPIGITPTELRDQLAVHLTLPEKTADFLLATVENMLKTISTVVNGQFISHNAETDQYYLDLKKDIDFDALVVQKGETLDNSTLDRYYFDVMASALEIKETPYVNGFRIWESELPWVGHGITRRGYLFLGAANERSTAHPARDYYIHFLALFGNGHSNGNNQLDEVYFSAQAEITEFVGLLRLFAGANEMSGISSGSNKDQYEAKVRAYRQQLHHWLNENFIAKFKVTILDTARPIAQAVAETKVNLREAAFREQVYRLSSSLLAPAFADKFPRYPLFSGTELNSATLRGAAEAALKFIATKSGFRLGQIILEGLALTSSDGGVLRLSVDTSPYARHFIDLIASLEAGRVINRAELLEGEEGALQDKLFKLEPELLALVLGALLAQGYIGITVPGGQLSDSDIENSALFNLDKLMNFTSINKPKPIPEVVIKDLFTRFEVDVPGFADPAVLSTGLAALQQAVTVDLDAAVRVAERLRGGIRFWDAPVLPAAKTASLAADVDKYRQFLTSLQGLTSPSRLANQAPTLDQVRSAFAARESLHFIRSLLSLLDDLSDLTAYLQSAHLLLTSTDPWQVEWKEAQDLVVKTLAGATRTELSASSNLLKGRLENLRAAYSKRYLALHQQHRLDFDQDTQKQKLITDLSSAKMRQLSRISILPAGKLRSLHERVGGLASCYSLVEADLKKHYCCQSCGFSPAGSFSDKAAQTLTAAAAEFDTLCTSWVEVLLQNLSSEEAARNLDLLEKSEKAAVQAFLQSRKLPEPVSEAFVNGVQNTLEGLEVVTLTGSDVLYALTGAGMPCTADELDKRYREFMQEQAAGKDRRKLRISIDW